MDEIQIMEQHQLTIQDSSSIQVRKLEGNKEVLTAMAYMCGQVARIAGKELPALDVVFILNEIRDKYSHESLGSHMTAFRTLSRSKIFGKVTLNDLITIHEQQLEETAINNERENEKYKFQDKYLGPIENIAGEYEKLKKDE